ncbi:hypothetical protein pW4_18 [Bacillus phage pW4]|uniref:Uncharacterized protein n=1 Tax=Bacillus phage pW4 TaxID=2500560 RepID=A0A3Q9R7K9_9CAUD|nr:hypothetical protein PP656_gp015 [Bacillus phage pW4]AZU99040.1 hypothetical protein pW4_18 [Bacillus phage pW4]
MFGKKALREELDFQRKHNLRLESEKWELQRETSRLERDNKNLQKSLDEHKNTIAELRKEKERLEDEVDRIDADRLNITKDYIELQNRQPTKDELILQLAELLLDENRGTEKDSLVKQMNAALRINNNQAVPQGAEPQWLNPQQ